MNPQTSSICPPEIKYSGKITLLVCRLINQQAISVLSGSTWTSAQGLVVYSHNYSTNFAPLGGSCLFSCCLKSPGEVDVFLLPEVTSEQTPLLSPHPGRSPFCTGGTYAFVSSF